VVLIFGVPIAALSAWLFVLALPAAIHGSWKRREHVGTLAVGGATFGWFFGLLFGSAGGGPTVLIGPLLGFVGFGGASAGLARIATSPGSSGVGLELLYGAIFWLLVLLFVGGWLFISMLGDCFDNARCLQNQRGAPALAGRLLVICAVLHVFLGFAFSGRLRRILKRKPPN
jgi:hypothetical protein